MPTPPLETGRGTGSQAMTESELGGGPPVTQADPTHSVLCFLSETVGVSWSG